VKSEEGRVKREEAFKPIILNRKRREKRREKRKWRVDLQQG
jgi:hypothetical protein